MFHRLGLLPIPPTAGPLHWHCARGLLRALEWREGAAILVSRLVTRPDMESVLLPEFLQWTQSELATTDTNDVR